MTGVTERVARQRNIPGTQGHTWLLVWYLTLSQAWAEAQGGVGVIYSPPSCCAVNV